LYSRVKDENNVWSQVYYDTLNVEIIANFEATPITIFQNEPIQYTDLSLGNAILWEWDFENDGIIDSFDPNPQWIYNSPGIYSVLLTVGDGENRNTILREHYITVIATQEIIIPEGWSGISSYIIPDDAELENIFAPVVDGMIILQNFAGMYWPTAGVNTLGNWDGQAGYQVKMETAQQVTFSGSMQENLTANLSAGWNYLPVLNACTNQAEELLSQIAENLQIVKEVAGYGVYWPQFGVNTLGLYRINRTPWRLASR